MSKRLFSTILKMQINLQLKKLFYNFRPSKWTPQLLFSLHSWSLLQQLHPGVAILLKTTAIHLNFLSWLQHKEPALPVPSRLTPPSLQPSRTVTQPMEALPVSKPFQLWPPALLQQDKMPIKTEKHLYGKKSELNCFKYKKNFTLKQLFVKNKFFIVFNIFIIIYTNKDMFTLTFNPSFYP